MVPIWLGADVIFDEIINGDGFTTDDYVIAQNRPPPSQI
jgi:hypothetical protein